MLVLINPSTLKSVEENIFKVGTDLAFKELVRISWITTTQVFIGVKSLGLKKCLNLFELY